MSRREKRRSRPRRTGQAEGLLPNARMIQGIFDDSNPATRQNWAYPDTKQWDPARNTKEFVGNMSSWKAAGLLAFTVGLQGGSPHCYGNDGASSRGQQRHSDATLYISFVCCFLCPQSKAAVTAN
jgi:hypothetical protein